MVVLAQHHFFAALICTAVLVMDYDTFSFQRPFAESDSDASFLSITNINAKDSCISP